MRTKAKNKKISIILVLTIIFSLFQSLGSIKNAFASDRYGCCFPDQERNIVTFIAKADGYDYSYVAGLFNDWKKDEKYKLEWKEDPNQKGVWKMMSDIPIEDLIPEISEKDTTTVESEPTEESIPEISNNNTTTPVSVQIEESIPDISEDDMTTESVPIKDSISEISEKDTTTPASVEIKDSIAETSKNDLTTSSNLQMDTEYRCEYKFILCKKGQPDQWMSNDGTDGENASFIWKYSNESDESDDASLIINTSSDMVSVDKPVTFASIKNSSNGNREILDDTAWSIDPEVNGAWIENDELKVSDSVPNDTKITLKAINGDLEATKEITVSKTEEEGTWVHFFKADGNYDGWSFWNFKSGEEGTQVEFQKDTDFGKAAFLTKSNVIVKKGEWKDQTIKYKIPSGAKDVYIIENDNNLYTDLYMALKACGPKINFAVMDSKDSIVAYLSENPLSTNKFKLYVNGKNVTTEDAGTPTIYKNDKKVVFDTSKLDIDPTSLIEIKEDTMFLLPKKVTLRNVLNDYYYDGNDMGAVFGKNDIKLKLWAPTAYKVEVLTYDSNEASNDSPSNTYEMDFDNSNGIHCISIPRNINENKYYMFRLYFKDRNVDGELTDKITYAVDPYAYGVGINGTKGVLVNLDDSSTKPENWESDSKPELQNPEDSILYEMHIRDFTIDPDSGVDEDKRGKYLGAVQEGTTYDDGKGNVVKTGIDHLKDLGVTHVHLLPVFDFDGVDESKDSGDDNRNWGYNPLNYNVPEGSYSSNANDPKARIKEFREMVQGFHENGIRVVMDMVYNHMSNTENMDKIVPDYYFRTWDNGEKSNSSQCGNEIASERPMVRKFIIDSNSHWVDDYNIDGLRFDLMAIIDKTTLNDVKAEVQSKDPSIIVYGEPWKAASSPLSDDQQTTKNKGIAAFNDTYRDALRGSNSLGQGFINGGINSDTSGKVQEGIKGSINGTVNDPDLIINYAEVHDNYTIWDQIEKSQTSVANGELRKNIPDNALNDWKVRQDILGNGLVLTSQGIPLFQEGSEILRTKQGDGNSYKSSDETNDIDWADKAEYKEVFDYYKGLIQLRKEHPAFRMTSKGQIQSSQEVYTLNNGDNGILIQHLKNNANGDKWKNILVIYNASPDSKHVTWLPKSTTGKWNVVADETGINLQSPIKEISQNENTVDLTVSPNSMMVLYDEEGESSSVSDLEWDYLFSDQSTDYMEPMQPKSTDPIKVRFRAKAGEVTDATVHYYDEADKKEHTIKMSKITDSNFYTEKGYDSSKIEFWEGTIPASDSTKYYNFEVNNSIAEKTAWISGGAGANNRGVTSTAPKVNPNDQSSGIDHGFSIVPDLNTPKWSKESILYQVMVDRFRDGDSKNNRVSKDPSQFGAPSEVSEWGSEIFNGDESDKVWNNQFFGGDLTGVEEAIPYLKDTLGVTGVYLMPVFESQSDHKYDADTYEYIDRNFGGNKALADLSSSLKSNQMNLMLDGVFNHTSIEGSLFNNNRDYYFNGTFEDRDGNMLDYYPWHGYSNLAKLNYGNEAVKDYIYAGENSIAKRYLRAPYNIDGWRLDAAEDLNTQPRDYKAGVNADGATDPTQQKNNLKIWQEFNNEVREVNPNTFILGEFWGNDNQWYYGKAWDGKMNYGGFLLPFIENRSANHWLGNQSLDNKGDVSVADIGIFSRNYFKGFPYQTILNSTNSISTHDKSRFLNWDYTGKNNNQMMEIASALQLTYPGIPMIYYGDEIGTAGKSGSDPYNRGTFDWNISNWNKEMLNDYRTLIATRKENTDAFVYGAFEEVASNRDGKYIVYSRYGNNDKALVILNNSGDNSTKSIVIDKLERYGFKNGDILKDVMSGNTATVAGDKVVLTSKDMSASVYVLSQNAPNVSDVTNTTEIGLTEENDGRVQLSNVKNVKLSNNVNDVTVSWDNYLDKDKASNIVIRAYEDNKVVKEVKVAPTEINATLKDISLEDVSTGKYSIWIKVEANRDLKDASNSNINDIYMDSEYVSLTKEPEEPEEPEDTTAPSIEKVTPENNAQEVLKNSNVVFEFNEDIVLSDSSKITVTDENGEEVEFEALASGKELIINPKEDLPQGASYKVIVQAGAVTDIANNGLCEDMTVEFKTKEQEKPKEPEKPEEPKEPEKSEDTTEKSKNEHSHNHSNSSSSSSPSNIIKASTVDKVIKNAYSDDVKISINSKGTVAEKEIFEVLAKNPTKNLTLEGDNYSWTFAGKDINSNIKIQTDMNTDILRISPNVEEINKITFGKPVENIYFPYNGELPGKAKVKVNVDHKYDNKTMLLYYYDSDKNRLVLASSNVKIENGTATFETKYCSDYILSETEIPGAFKIGWNKNLDGTWLFLKEDFTNFNGWLNDNGVWYFMKPSGIMQTGWLNDNGTWYFMRSWGGMQTGWLNDNGTWYFMGPSGAMKTGWLNNNNKWYYLNQSGEMLSNTSISGYELSSDGKWIA
ncbi:type I pullulanase [Clostridium sp. BJN0001]|uniref:type I pullulanase n=1 Tax=Clostridium sp. BJN0001 TaxID=2930219 RepID=UPI001FD08EF9|nr:type I pullulanase [Clostridium sp. BJN0001]